MTSTVWLIRHAQSAGNAGLPTDYPDSNPLTATGLEDAQRIAKAIAPAPDLIVTSPYQRARQTAEPTRLRYPTARFEVLPVHEFTFLAPAGFVGTTVLDRRPAVVDYWDRADPAYCHGPGAESWQDLFRRVRALLERLRQEPGFTVVFTHDQFIKAVLFELRFKPEVLHRDCMISFREFLGQTRVANGEIVRLSPP